MENSSLDALIKEFHDAMLAVYRQADDAVGYRATRFLQAVRRKGGLKTAKAMLKPRTLAQRAGLDRLLKAGRPELTVEAIVLDPRYARLFTTEELAVAASRLSGYVATAKRLRMISEGLFPEELDGSRTYTEGAKRQITVNAYERDPRARQACIEHHGSRCAVCDLSFEERYGDIGKGFIHVHHLRPLAAKGSEERVDPKIDLVPVCPNCHAMLHTDSPPHSVVDLKRRLVDRKAS